MSDKIIIAAKLDVTKIRKELLFPGKAGAKYLDIILLETPTGKYGDNFMVTQSVSKEDRLAGKRGPILGNAKYLGRQNTAAPTPDAPAPTDSDDVPF